MTLLGALSALGACSSSTEAPSSVPTRTCGLRVWHRPASAQAHVEIIGDWDGWKRPGTVPQAREDGWRVASLDLPAGEHAYAIVEDGVWLTDKNEPMTDTHDGREVTVATAAACDQPELRVDGVDTTADGKATVRATFVSASSGVAIDPATIVAKGRDGSELRVASVDPARGSVTLETTGLKRGKYT